MNGKIVMTGILVGAMGLGAALQYGRAASPAPAPASRIGLVRMRNVLSGSQKYNQYQAQRAKQHAQVAAQLDDLNKQLAKEEGDLKAILPGTADYLKQYQIVLELRGKLQTQKELLNQRQMMEDKEWLEGLYQEALKATESLAKEQGLELVLEGTEPKFPMASVEEIFTVISTHKVLYCGAGIDLTDEVIARVDASVNLNP